MNFLKLRLLIAQHYAVWNDTFVTYSEGSHHPVSANCLDSSDTECEFLQAANFPDGFDGVIPVHGPTVANIIRGILPVPPRWRNRTVLPGTAWYEEDWRQF